MSRPDDLADDVRRFIVERIDSIELIEVLLALRAERDRTFTAEGLGRSLGTTAQSIATRLAALGAASLAVGDAGGWRYRPANPALDELVGRVEQSYRERRMTVIALIYAPKPSDIQLFADAFRLRPPKQGDQR